MYRTIKFLCGVIAVSFWTSFFTGNFWGLNEAIAGERIAQAQGLSFKELGQAHKSHFSVHRQLDNSFEAQKKRAKRVVYGDRRNPSRSPASMAVSNPNSNYRLPVEWKPADAPGKAVVYSACTTPSGITYAQGSQQYANCMDPTSYDYNSTSPSNYRPTGKGMAVFF